MRRGFFQALSVVLVWLLLAASAHADKRVALVIGNAGYQAVPKLGNPTRDADAMAAALQRLGFTVRSANDIGFDAMRRALKDFAGMSAGADLAVIFYAGHGMEIGGENYLVPVDARLATDVDVQYEAIPLSLAMGAVDGARGMRLIILDACRNNPFLATMQVGAKSRSIGRGLARVEPDSGTLVAYSAKEGTTAEDGDSEHSPFTKALLEHLEEPGIDVQFLLREVRDSVLEETSGRQEPFTYGSLPGRAVLLSPAKEPPPPPPPAAAASDTGNEIAAEVAFWNTVKDSGDRKLLESYLAQYPTGRFTSLARIFIARLDSEAAKPPQPAAAVVVDTGKDKAASPPASAAAPLAVASATGNGGDAGGPPPPPAAAVAASLPADKTDGGSGSPPSSGGAAPAIGAVASLPPPSAPVEPPGPSPELIRSIQKELTRVGCDVGSVDGVWGRKGQSAVEAFVRYAKISLASLDPSDDLLNALKGYGGRACPLVCGVRYEAKGDSCVLKSCPKGMSLNPNGSCYAPPPPQPPKQAAPANQGNKKGAVASSGGGCVKETQAQCEDRMASNNHGRSAFGRGGMDDFVISAHCSAPANRICR